MTIEPTSTEIAWQLARMDEGLTEADAREALIEAGADECSPDSAPARTPRMAYRVFITFADDQPEQVWEDLSYSKAHWRYHWIKRRFWNGSFRNVKRFGIQPTGCGTARAFLPEKR